MKGLLFLALAMLAALVVPLAYGDFGSDLDAATTMLYKDGSDPVAAKTLLDAILVDYPGATVAQQARVKWYIGQCFEAQGLFTEARAAYKEVTDTGERGTEVRDPARQPRTYLALSAPVVAPLSLSAAQVVLPAPVTTVELGAVAYEVPPAPVPVTVEIWAVALAAPFTPPVVLSAQVQAVDVVQSLDLRLVLLKAPRYFVDYEGEILSFSYLGQQIEILRTGLEDGSITEAQAEAKSIELQGWADRREVYKDRN